MHVLQPKHAKLKQDEVKELLEKYNISIAQLPKIKHDDPMIADSFAIGDVVKLERKEEDKTITFYRVVA